MIYVHVTDVLLPGQYVVQKGSIVQQFNGFFQYEVEPYILIPAYNYNHDFNKMLKMWNYDLRWLFTRKFYFMDYKLIIFIWFEINQFPLKEYGQVYFNLLFILYDFFSLQA